MRVLRYLTTLSDAVDVSSASTAKPQSGRPSHQPYLASPPDSLFAGPVLATKPLSQKLALFVRRQQMCVHVDSGSSVCTAVSPRTFTPHAALAVPSGRARRTALAFTGFAAPADDAFVFLAVGFCPASHLSSSRSRCSLRQPLLCHNNTQHTHTVRIIKR